MSPSSSPSTLLKRLRYALWAAALVMAVLITAYRFRPQPAVPELPVLHEVPAFSLTDRDGEALSRDDLEGKPWVADFVFTRCPGVCPIMTRRMQELVADIPDGAARYVSVSVDPAYDTPEILQAYAEKHEAGPDWHFLTGPEDTVYSLIKEGFLLALDPSPEVEGAEPIVHSNRFVLVDAEGLIRGYYNSFDEDELAKLRVDLKALAGVG